MKSNLVIRVLVTLGVTVGIWLRARQRFHHCATERWELHV